MSGLSATHLSTKVQLTELFITLYIQSNYTDCLFNTLTSLIVTPISLVLIFASKSLAKVLIGQSVQFDQIYEFETLTSRKVKNLHYHKQLRTLAMSILNLVIIFSKSAIHRNKGIDVP